MKAFFYLTLAFFTFLTLSGCGDDDDNGPGFTTPETYTFIRDGQSTVSFSGQSTRIAMAEELTAAMLDFTRDADDLNNMFRNAEGTNPFADAALNASTKSVRSKVAASNDLFAANAVGSALVRETFDGWINAQVNEVFPGRNQLATDGQAGQLADGGSVRYVNARGYEYNQFFGKSLIGALMYDQLANNYLSPAVLDRDGNAEANDAETLVDGRNYTAMEHFWDEAYGYLFGASADPANGLADLGTADGFLNKYLGRVETDPDFAGIAERIETAFRRGRAAIVAGDYVARDEQGQLIKDELAKVIAVRAVYYLQQGKAALSATPPDYGAAFHDLSEGAGFVYSLRFTERADGTSGNGLSASAFASLLRADTNGFWGLTATELDNLSADIAAAYGITVADAGN